MEYALSPATVSSGILHHGSKAGAEIYKTAIAKLATPYSVDGEGLKTFINKLQDRSTTTGWNRIVTPQVNGHSIDLINHYGTIAMDNLKVQCETYIDTQYRDAQNSTVYFIGERGDLRSSI